LTWTDHGVTAKERPSRVAEHGVENETVSETKTEIYGAHGEKGNEMP
jgi:hypothetical protein